MGSVVYNGKSSLDFHIHVEHPPKYRIPEKDIELIRIPGRSGDLVKDYGTYKNVLREYDISIASHEIPFSVLADRISMWLHSSVHGYARLEDSYEPKYFRQAFYQEETEVENILAHGGRATIAFVCKPQRYLKIGEHPQEFTATDNVGLRNPTNMPAKPLIRVYGAGQLGVGDCTLTITAHNNAYIDIDCDMQDCFFGATNLNQNVTLAQHRFPTLKVGTTGFSLGSGITKVIVWPRWWCL